MERPITSQVIATLSAIGPVRDRQNVLAQAPPAVGSPAQVDASRSLGNATFTHAAIASSIAVDHVEAWHRLLSVGRLQTLAAHASLARAAMEGAVTCRWLVDPRIDSEERRWRGAIAELEDHRQRREFERTAGITDHPPPSRSGAERYAEHERRMRRERVWRADHNQRMPAVTDLFREYAIADKPGGGEWLYRLLSAFAHGKQWSILLGEIGERRAAANMPDVYIARLTSSDEVTLRAALHTVDVLRAALDELERYAGRSVA